MDYCGAEMALIVQKQSSVGEEELKQYLQQQVIKILLYHLTELVQLQYLQVMKTEQDLFLIHLQTKLMLTKLLKV